MTTVNVTHVKGCVEDLEIGEGTVQQIRNGKLVSLTKFGAASIPWSVDPTTGEPISIRVRMEGLETELTKAVASASASASAAAVSEKNAASSEHNAAVSEKNAASSEHNAAVSEKNAASSEHNAALSAAAALTSQVTVESLVAQVPAIVTNGIIEDSSVGTLTTWSSSKVSAALDSKVDTIVVTDLQTQVTADTVAITDLQTQVTAIVSDVITLDPATNFVTRQTVTTNTLLIDKTFIVKTGKTLALLNLDTIDSFSTNDLLSDTTISSNTVFIDTLTLYGAMTLTVSQSLVGCNSNLPFNYK